MRLTKKQLALIIENFINEEDNWLGDEEDELGDLSVNITTDSKIKNAFNTAKEKVILDLESSDTAAQNISEEMVANTIKIINKTHLHIADISETAAKYKGVNALALHVSYGDKEGDNRDILHFDTIPQDINVPDSLRQKFNEDNINNPIIVVFKLYAELKEEQEIIDLLIHEVGHIKNSSIKALSEKTGTGPKSNLNVNEVKNVLRTDLSKGGNAKQVAEYILFHEKPPRINEKMSGSHDLVLILSKYYVGVFQDPPDNLGIEEFSVRLSALKSNPQALADFKAGKKDYSYFKKNYNTDIADLMLFISEKATIENVNKIVKNTISNKSVTV